MPIVHLQRIVAGIPRPLTNIDIRISPVWAKVNRRCQVVDQDLLYVAIPGCITSLGSNKCGYILGRRSDRNLVHIAIANDMPSQAPHVADTQEVIPRKLMLHSQAELLDTGVLWMVSHDG